MLALVAASGRRTQAPSESAAGFHHVHMNVVDPERSIVFYMSAFEQTRRTKVGGWDSVQTENVYILFNKVPRPASADLETPLWHFGWNSPNVVADYQRLAARGVVFFRVPPPSGHITAPDGNDVEIAPGSATSGGSTVTAFNHVHLMSAAPLCAAEWYERVLGLKRLRAAAPQPTGDCHVPFGTPRDPGNQIHEPNARLLMDDIVLSIYPNQRPGNALLTPRGHVLDHVAMTYPDVAVALARLRKLGVKVLKEAHNLGDSKAKAAMIEGPDSLAIELVEHPRRSTSSR
jgi:catechol 2,3-dioxygenase-like lactoylglutathione lyase family enzyme